MKTCAKCKESKDYSEYRRHARNPDGFQYYCKKCQNEMNYISKLKNKPKIKRAIIK